jgi:hypothetical protein
VSMERIVAWASEERTKAAHNCPGSAMSST